MPTLSRECWFAFLGVKLRLYGGMGNGFQNLFAKILEVTKLKLVSTAEIILHCHEE